MKLTIVRHGQTVENINNITQGQLPGELTEEGKNQAQKVAALLGDQTFDYIISSDLARSSVTAEVIRKYHEGTSFSLTDKLREYSYGIHEGKRNDLWDWHAFPGEELHRKAPGGENAIEVSTRVAECINQLLERFPKGNILVSTHGGPMRLLTVMLGQISFEDRMALSIGNCEVIKFEINEPLKHLGI